jgi:hypothetical protein
MNVPRSAFKQRRLPAEMSPSRKIRDIELAARQGIFKILEPIADFALNCGLSVKDVNSIFRQAAVWSIAARQIDYARRINVSGISATTGLSRGEISKVLQHAWSPRDPVSDRNQRVTNRILAAWQSDSRFLTASGHPRELKLYGRGPTFESLVKTHGRGIPIRAILDELLRIDAIELKSGQKIIPKACTAVARSLTARNISKSGDLASKFLSATLRSGNISHPPMNVDKASSKLSTNNALCFPVEPSAEVNALLVDLQQKSKSKLERSRAVDQSHLDRLAISMVFTQEMAKRIRKGSQKRRNFRRG